MFWTVIFIIVFALSQLAVHHYLLHRRLSDQNDDCNPPDRDVKMGNLGKLE